MDRPSEARASVSSEQSELDEAAAQCSADTSATPTAGASEAARAAEGEPGRDTIPTMFDDEEERVALIRAEAVRFASIACARALRTELAADPTVITRYVDDALQACGRIARPVVRLHPDLTASYRPQRDVDVVADEAVAFGEVIVECEAGSLLGSIDGRASLLALAAAHA